MTRGACRRRRRRRRPAVSSVGPQTRCRRRRCPRGAEAGYAQPDGCTGAGAHHVGATSPRRQARHG
eukprot:321486-Chlamydomonas_euryale.AAC.1